MQLLNFGIWYVMSFTLLQGVPDFAADCPCSVWCRGLTSCILYVGPLFGNLVWKDISFVSLTWWRTTFSLFWYVYTYIVMPYNMIILYFHLTYFHVWNSALLFTYYSGTVFLHRRSLGAFYFIVYNGCNYLSMLGLKLVRTSERDPWDLRVRAGAYLIAWRPMDNY